MANVGLRRVTRGYLRRRYTILFYSLLGTLVAVPLLGALGLGGQVLEGFLALNLVAAALGVAERRQRNVLLVVASAVLALRLGSDLHGAQWLATASLALWSVLALLAAAETLRVALRTRIADAEHVYAALSVYLLIGLFLGAVYFALEEARPGSFAAAGGPETPDPFSRVDAIYFSFVTLATLGYGDVLPRSDVARGLAIFEAVAGQLYVAVLVALVIGSYARGPRSS